MFSDEETRGLVSGAAEFGIDLNETAVRRMELLVERLAETTRSINLTRIPREGMVTLHLLDSLSAGAICAPRPATSVVDIGTGAGFPGLPLAIAYPDVAFCLVDATVKKLRFVDSIVAELGLENVQTLHARAEDAGRHTQLRFDLAVARALGDMSTLARWVIPWLKPCGKALAYKSAGLAEEVGRATPVIASLGYNIEKAVEFVLPGTDVKRQLILMSRASR